ncbi:AAA family ATPase [Lewinella sp. JB7]|uniref:AAA family ATPase n=1 Tax=Lewinella sp. JB7 TaxID=2962887 RepID=UPI0020C9AC98|nr:AAA family ATPase [Lewinella sp. JB7]MCP9234860.1 AAA family ATPase [Lewinella sp. JB7]
MPTDSPTPELLFHSERTQILRVPAQAERAASVLKVLNLPNPTAEQVHEFYNEWRVLRTVDRPGIRPVLEKLTYGGKPAMRLAYIEGRTLREVAQEPMPLATLLDYAIQLSEILEELHRSDIIHKNVCPDNVMVETASGAVWLIDYGIATRLNVKATYLGSPEHIAGNLAYISPEQTGRMNRTLDHRSDFYSLGVCLYELWTGRLPFLSSDALELVHCHLAVVPTQAREWIARRKPIDAAEEAFSRILQKLLRKNAEDRYQSARGIRADLDWCRSNIDRPAGAAAFCPGRGDFSERFEIPQQLYGREAEIKFLIDTYRKTGGGVTQLLLVSGHSGVGKSALVYEIHKPLTESKGYFIEGKFDQYQRNFPYYAWIQAFDNLVQLLLTESPVRLERWKRTFLRALAGRGRVLTELIPSLEKIIGPQRELPELPPRENQQRFHTVLTQFVRTVARPRHPLFVFIDDWQWADAPSLEVLELLTRSSDSALIITGAFRDNEVPTNHPFRRCIRRIRESDCRVSEITLESLSTADINRLIADTVGCTVEEARPLSHLLAGKTNGNAFFLRQMLQSLYERGGIEPVDDPRTGKRWKWDMAKITALRITDNVVELMVEKISQQPADTQRVLDLASCIGTLFPLQILSVVYQRDESETFDHLQPALREGFILPTADQFAFAHDRIRQAVYSRVPEEKREGVHYEIGQLLLAGLQNKQIAADRLIDVVNHYNTGRRLIERPEERTQLAKLNLRVGIQAKKSIANDSAFHYLQTGLELLGEDPWDKDYELTYALYRHFGEVLAITLHFNRAEAVFKEAFGRARHLAEKAEMAEFLLWISLLEFTDLSGIRTASEVLALCGFDLPEDEAVLGRRLAGLEQRLVEQIIRDGPEVFLQLAEMTDEKSRLGMRILPKLLFALNHQIGRFTQYYFTVCSSVLFCLAHGKNPNLLPILAHFGSILAAKHRRPALAYQIARVADTLALDYPNFHARVQYINRSGLWCRIYGDRLDHLIPFFEEGQRIGLENGNTIGVSICQYDIIIHRSRQGSPIQSVIAECQEFEQFARKMQFSPLLVYTVQERYKLSYLRTGQQQYRLRDTFSEDASLTFYEQHINNGWLGHCKLAQHFWCREYREVIRTYAVYRENIKACESNILWADHYFFLGVSLLVSPPPAEPEVEEQDGNLLTECRERLGGMAAACPANFAHKHHLLEALFASRKKPTLRAIGRYEQAITTAEESEFPAIAALAHEFFGRFWHRRSSTEYARIHFSHARRSYRRWQADYVADRLTEEFPAYLREDTPAGTPATTGRSPQLLDLASLLKASQILSGEIVLSNLIAKLLPLVIENAGAERGYLLSIARQQFTLLARAQVNDTVEIYDADSGSNTHRLPFEILHYVLNSRAYLVLQDATRSDRFSHDIYVQQVRPKSVLCYPIFRKTELSHLIYLENNLSTGVFTEQRLKILQSLSAQIAISIDNALLYKNLDGALQKQLKITEAYSRFVPHTFLRTLGKESILDVRLGDQSHQRITVLFSDIRDYTRLSETLSPAENFNFLNAFLKRVAPAINEHDGFICQYFGDGIMALFLERPENALRAALHMQERLRTYNEERSRKGRQPIRIGVGMHTGTTMLGILGDAHHQQATVVSDTVNTASRLEGLTKFYYAEIIISQAVMDSLESHEDYHHRFLGKVQVKGKQTALPVYEVFNGDIPQQRALKLAADPDFQRGLVYYFDREFIEALFHFKRALEHYPEDSVIKRYFNNAARLITEDVPADWTGADVMMTK